MSTGAELHAACEALSPLLGTWRGKGEGHYPTIEDFDYLEELTFSHVGKPFLAMTQRTRDSRSDAPLHAEVGYLRPQPNRGIEMVLTQPTGVVEIHNGSITERHGAVVVDLRTERVEGTRTAKPITEVRRRLEVTGDTLVSEMWMAAMGQPLTHHLRAELTRA
ncbi:MAG: FABP family protein [Actinobacteria bacterium]|nr:FABP family protein [Actinomycetota bacterium]NIS33700.1 FABP family protein [Actinomycetota bacterium]NIT97031.1 FABP family protein [Actinomycetota bacterium]NIU20699.1 FABP family protein [Actinomycetota bacterium]NIU68551.1 FABP family protein [Actinomycetota bacterium]